MFTSRQDLELNFQFNFSRSAKVGKVNHSSRETLVEKLLENKFNFFFTFDYNYSIINSSIECFFFS